MLLADTCAEESLTAACLSGDIILDRFSRGDRTKVQKSATSPCCTAHSTRHPDWTHNSEHSSRPVGGEVRAELQPRRRPREPICRGRGAGVGERARRGRGSEAERGATQRAHERRRRRLARAELGGVGRGTTSHLQRVHDRLGARSSAMTKATTQPAVRAEGRSPRATTSLRRASVPAAARGSGGCTGGRA